MTRPATPGLLCDRAHEWVSLRLDGELSQLEGAMLDAHLDRCGTCRGFAVAVAGLTHELRAAPLEPVRPLAAPRRHAAFRAVRVTAVAAVMLVAAGLGSVFAPTLGSEHAAIAPPSRAALVDDERQLRDIRRAQLQSEAALRQTTTRTVIGHLT